MTIASVSARTWAHADRPRPTAATQLGTVVGRIDARSGDGYAKLSYGGGAVLALRRSTRVSVKSPTWRKVTLPTDVVAHIRVPVGGYFHFSLPPAHYVSDLPRYARGAPRLTVTARKVVTVHANLPNSCT
jgi:hypothetical protein